VRQRLLRVGAQRLQTVGVDHNELAPGRRKPRPGELRAGQRNGHQAPARLVLVGCESGRPLQYRARRTRDRVGGVLGGRHRLEERLGVTDHAPAEIAAGDDDPAVIVRAPHRLRGEPSCVGVPLEHPERLLADDRLRDRDARRVDR
jgi:hypothetical protein